MFIHILCPRHAFVDRAQRMKKEPTTKLVMVFDLEVFHAVTLLPRRGLSNVGGQCGLQRSSAIGWYGHPRCERGVQCGQVEAEG
ncbi:MAG: hypothetical protein B7733_24660 [Myxococcales bacterium FL481]|nr:MAG: hypothetical protein B7733_24660 [Myxococcales bacterium FL481]